MGETNRVVLDTDHPGFRDASYRRRRDEIASLAEAHVSGTAPANVPYTQEEQDVWGTALAHLAPLHARYACETYQACFPKTGFNAAAIPTFKEVNARLEACTGFRLEPVAGLVTPRAFMDRLADGVFCATQYMRHHSAPLYTPEPDVIHELVGHVPLLCDPGYAELHRLFGRATRAADETRCLALIRVYWYVLEFGVLKRGEHYSVLGAGLLSSFGELGSFEDKASLQALDLDVVAGTDFDPTDYQRTLFYGTSEAQVLADVRAWLLQGLRG